jgi:lipopolysaccharide export system permease protein
MNLRPLIIDRYIFREFVLAFFAVMAFCALLLLVASIFDRFSEILEYGASMYIVVMFFLSKLPGQLMHVVPIASMLAVLFSIGALARTNEVLAMLTSGVHGLRLSVPIIFGGILIVGGTFVMNEYVVPVTERANKYYDNRLEDRDLRRVTMNADVFARGRNEWFYMARLYSNVDKQLIKPIIVNLSPDHSTVLYRIEAETATFQENKPGEKQSLWEFEQPRIWQFDSSGNLTTYTAEATPLVISLEEDLTTILSQQMKPEEMNFHQLRNRIRILEARNQPTTDLKTDLLRKVTFPVGILIIMMIGFSYAVKSRAGTAMTIVGYGIVWAVAYYLVNAMLQALGRAGSIPPTVATIVPTIAFAIIAVYLMRRSYQWHA